MNKLARQLKSYDRFLFYKKLLDGTLKIIRKSPFSNFQFDVLTVQNQYVGSGKWIMRKINLKDNQRHNLAGEVYRNNWNLRYKKEDNRIHKEIADFILQEKVLL